MGAGKTSLGQNMALSLGLVFFDLDREIEKKTGFTISETIFNKGELFFRKLERDTLLEILEKDNFILSTGGGTPCYYDNAELIANRSLSIYLLYSVPTLFERLNGKQKQRPLIAHLDGPGLKEYIGKHLMERASFYEKSTLTINAESKSIEDISKEIRELIHDESN